MNNNYKNTHYNERGFTLVELLAVIVVLAVVMLIAVNAVLPRMEDARKQAFSIEANGLIKSAQQYIVTETLMGTVNIASEGDSVCVTADDLIDKGHSSLEKAKYDGKVVITKSGSIYLYSVSLKNASFMVQDLGTSNGANVSIESTDVKKADTTFNGACS